MIYKTIILINLRPKCIIYYIILRIKVNVYIIRVTASVPMRIKLKKKRFEF